MLFLGQEKEKQATYKKMLNSSGALSSLFSNNKSPFIVSRNVEKAFCIAFGATDLGRDDSSADATLGSVGIGLKTFIHGNGKTLQKIAEFNKDSSVYRSKQPKELISIVAKLRNERLDFTMRTYGLEKMIYHCVTRKPGQILIFESPMEKINIPDIKNIKLRSKTIITFEDGINEYSFNMSKSTLYQRFYTENPSATIEVSILINPHKALAKLMDIIEEDSMQPTYDIVNDELSSSYSFEEESYLIKDSDEFVILPLFSDRGRKRHVPEASGLNQWNAKGRKRHHNEVYIPIPRWIHKVFPDFFPERDSNFELRLPDKKTLSAKVSQDNSKALMTNPNASLGEWLLRDVLNLEESELLTYEQLEIFGIDSVIIQKNADTSFSINFTEIGTFDEFESENKD